MSLGDDYSIPNTAAIAPAAAAKRIDPEKVVAELPESLVGADGVGAVELCEPVAVGSTTVLLE